MKAIRPYLWVVSLNGMKPGGPKILPFGTGMEVEEILRGNLRGLGFTPK